MCEEKGQREMTEIIPRQTAKIIQFPTERRAGKGNVQPVSRSVAERPAVATVESGGGWYHDAAIQDASTRHH
jgi:hypothetical protein